MMKQFYKIMLLMLTVFWSGFGYGQGLENFASSNATTSYGNSSFVGNNGITWTYVASRDGNNDANSSGINLPALMLRRASSGSKITSSTISGGIGNISIKLYKGFTGANNRQIELFVNNVSYGTSTPFDDFNLHVFSIAVNIEGDVIVEIRTTTEGQIIIDDIEWTSYSATPDETAPSFITDYPNVSAIVSDGFTINVQLDEPGTFYYAVAADGTTAPTSAEIVAATGFVATGNVAVVEAGVTVSTVISGLTTGVTYDLYVVAQDDEDPANLMADVDVALIADVIPVADVTVPTLQSATTGTGAATTIMLTFDENITAENAASGFSITINSTPATITLGEILDATLTLTLTEEIFVGDVVTLSYNGGTIEDLSQNALASFSGQAVTNNATTVLVADLAALRAFDPGTNVLSTVFRVSGEVVLTYQRTSRNQKYVQDANAGVLIDDPTARITSTYAIGDGITGLEGTLGNFSGLLQFTPTTRNPGAATSNGNVITPVAVSPMELSTNSEPYESRVIVLEAVRFTTAGINFDAGADNYTVTDGEFSFIFRDGLGEVADYTGFPQPFGRVDIVGFGAENGGNEQIIPYTSNAITDNYAPVFTAGPEASVSFFTADIAFTSDEPGTVYYLTVANDATAPTNEEIMTTGTATAMTVGANTLNLTAMEDNSFYDVYVLATDANDNSQTTAVKLDVDTPELIFDSNSNVTVAAEPIEAMQLSSVNFEGDVVLSFTVTDAGGGDLSSTFLTGGTIVPGALNTADWMTSIAEVALSDGGIGSLPGTITESGIVFDASAEPLELPDGQSVSLYLYILLSESVMDGDVLQFEIPAAGGITADGNSGSSFPAELPGGAVTSAAHTIQVEATALEVEVFEAVAIATDFELSVAAVDANGNVDTAPRTVSLSQTTGTGTLASVTGLASQAMTDGVYTWADLQVELIGDYTFTVDDDGSALTATTGTVNAYEKVGDLFISEYIEGGSNNKAIEIYNNLGGTADLSRYTVNLYGNGSPTATQTLVLSDVQPSLANGELLVIANAGSVAAILDVSDITSAVTFFNGDDALALLKDDVVIDAFGAIGTDPGSAWDVAGVTGATLNKTLVRKNTVVEGNPSNLGSFGTNTEDSEWIVYPQDDFNYIGFHIFGEQPFPLITIDESGFNGGFGYVVNGISSAVSSYSLSTEDLSQDLLITPPVGFELSADEAFSGTVYTNASPWTITPVDGVVTQTVYVRFTPPAADGGNYGGDITHVSADANTRTVAVSGVEGEPESPNLSGIVINEILPDPNSTTFNYDTDGSGVAADQDEFVEIYNSGDAPVNIGGWQLRDEAATFFTFPAETILGVGKYAGVLSLIQAGGALPTPSEGNFAFAADISNWSLTNGGENVALYDPNTNSYIQMKYGASEADANFSSVWSGATLIGIVEAWGGDTDGTSLVREPAGSATIVVHNTIQGADNASFAEPTIDPNAPAITLNSDTFDGAYGNLTIGAESAVRTYTVSGVNLAADIVITAPAQFLVSTDGTNFSGSVSLTPATGSVSETTISVKYAPTEFGSADGTITHTTTDGSQLDLDVSGAGVDENTIYFNGFGSCDNLGGFTAQSVSGAQGWACTANGETGSGIAMSGFSFGTFAGVVNEDWIVSPSIDLSAFSGADLSFDTDVAFDGTGTLTIHYSSDYSGDVTTATWTELNATIDVYTAETENDGVFVSSGDVGLPVGSTIYIAFKYVSVDDANGAVEYRLDNFLIYETQPFFEIVSTSFNDDFGQQNVGTQSVATSFIVDGFGLTGSVTVTPPAHFEVSTSSTFATISTSTNPLSFNPSAGIVNNVQVYVRFAPTTAGAKSGNVTVATTGFTTVNLAVSGTGVAIPTGIADELGIAIYPNPTASAFQIKNDSGKQIRVELYSLQGARMALKVKNGMYDISSLESGVYLVTLIDEKGNHLGSERILKQ